MTSQVRTLCWHNDEVPHPRFDVALTTRTQVSLPRLIGLDRAHDFVVETSHSLIDWRYRGIEHGCKVRSTSADSCVCGWGGRYAGQQ